MRAAVERLGQRERHRLTALDPHLLYLRALETASDLPPLLEDVRPWALVAQDAISSTWYGWCIQTGHPVLVRCLRPDHLRDPVWRRRLEAGTHLVSGMKGVARLEWRATPGQPHVLVRLTSPPLQHLLPVQDPPDAMRFPRLVAEALAALATLHDQGLVHGCIRSNLVLQGDGGAVLVWLDPVLAERPSPQADLRDLARTLLSLDPHQSHPLGELLSPWRTTPPDSAHAALFLVRRTLRDILLSARHSLVLRSRHSQRIRALSRLHATASALAGSLPPPPGRCCLNANEEGVFYLVHSDGRELRGGAVPAIPDERLPLLYQPGSEINAQATRALLRAWARRSRSEPDPRQPVQRRWAGSDQAGEAIVRWMVARNRLRALLLLLERAMR